MNKFTRITLLSLVFTVVFGWWLSIAPVKSSAVTGSEFNASRIIDDGIFFNPYTMNTSEIQNFLNAKVPVCQGGYTCLKDYSQSFDAITGDAYCNGIGSGSKSAANIIFDVARACGVNPQSLIVLLQKEQGLVLSTHPGAYEYKFATGYCVFDSDTAPPACAGTDGFFNQVYYAARQFKKYVQQPDSFKYALGRTSFVAYQANNPGCSGTDINMQTAATAALYNYTPYQPNTAALANLYGTGDGCSAYGNRNFWRTFNDWFGPTLGINSSYFGVLQNPDGSGRWYLAVNGAKHYIPSDLYLAWGLDKYPVQTVPQSFFDSFPTYGNIGRLLKDEWQNYFFIDGGSTHYIRDSKFFTIWNLDPNTAVQSTGLTSALSNGGNWVGRFMKEPGNSNIYLMDGGKKHLVPSNSSLLYQWRYSPDQLTQVSSAYLSSLTDGGNITQYVNASGRNFVIDSGRVLYFDNSNIENGYGAQTYMPVNLLTLSMMPIEKAGNFITNSTGANWYMLEGGKKHYIPNLAIATAWGYSPGQSLTRYSDPLMNTFTDGGNLSHIVQTNPSGGGSLLWVVDGTKHYIPTQAVVDAWIASGSTLPIYSNQSLETLQRGTDLTTLVQANGSPFTYALDNGTKRYLALPSLVNAWGSPAITSVSKLNSNLVSLVPEASPVSVVVKNSATYYLLVNGAAYPINPIYADSWRANSSTPQIANSTLARFSVSSEQAGPFIKVGGTYYLVNDLYTIPVTRHLDAFGITDANSLDLPSNYFSILPEATYLLKSTAQNDPSAWLVNKGSKTLLASSAQALNYGFISQGVGLTALSPAVLSAIPNSGIVPSLLATKTGAGVKLLSFGYALGFPDGNTLTNYVSSTNPIVDFSPSIYDKFSLKKNASILVRDDNNKVYEIRSGSKRLINNQSIIASTYPGVPVVYLESTAMASIPTGAPIN